MLSNSLLPLYPLESIPPLAARPPFETAAAESKPTLTIRQPFETAAAESIPPLTIRPPFGTAAAESKPPLAARPPFGTAAAESTPSGVPQYPVEPDGSAVPEAARSSVFELQCRLSDVFAAARRHALSEGSAELAELLPVLNPDGIYGAETRSAAALFQLMRGLPVTGAVDFATWNELSRAAAVCPATSCVQPDGTTASACTAKSCSAPIYPFDPSLLAARRLSPGDRSDLVTIVQIMLAALSLRYTSFPKPSSLADESAAGFFGSATEAAVRSFQLTNALPVTGAVDLATWNSLAVQYNILLGEQ